MKAPRRRRTHGFATVELALITLFLLPLGACVIVLGGLLHHYAGLERASYMAARYLASVPRTQMMSDAGFGQAGAAARALFNASLDEAGLPAVPSSHLTFFCEPTRCGASTPPGWIKVQVQADATNRRWDALSGYLLGGQGMALNVNVALRYEN